MYERIICPVCGKAEIEGEFEICSECGWAYDWYQYENQDTYAGFNGSSVNTYKFAMKEWGEGFTVQKFKEKLLNDESFRTDFRERLKRHKEERE